MTASGAGRLCDEQNFVRSAALRCIKEAIRGSQNENPRYSKARAAYEEVLRSDPTNEEAKDALRMADLEENGQAAPRQPRQPRQP